MKYLYKLRNWFTDSIGWVLVELSFLISKLGFISFADKLYSLGNKFYSYYKDC